MKCTPLDPDYLIAMRDGFCCTYCSQHKMPNGDAVSERLDDLVIVEIIPKKKGGSDSEENKTTACIECARIKGDRIAFPGVDYGTRDRDGWHDWKRFGKWKMVVIEETCAIEHNRGYWFGADRCWEDGCNPSRPWTWEDQIEEKGCWCPFDTRSDCKGNTREKGWLCPSIDMDGLVKCLRVARSIYAKPARSKK
jgi:hypothetical protein